MNGSVVLLHLKRTLTSSSCVFGEGEEEAACAACHVPSASARTSPAPVSTPGTSPGQLVQSGQSVSVCELGADGLRPSRMGEWQSFRSMARVKDSCGQKAEWMAE